MQITKGQIKEAIYLLIIFALVFTTYSNSRESRFINNNLKKGQCGYMALKSHWYGKSYILCKTQPDLINIQGVFGATCTDSFGKQAFLSNPDWFERHCE